MSTTISIKQGSDQVFPMTIKTKNGVPIDLTGAVVFFTVKKRTADGDEEAVIQKDVSSHTNPTGGITTITLLNTDTDVDPSPINYPYLWDIKIKKSDNFIYLSETGDFIVKPAVTQRKEITP